MNYPSSIKSIIFSLIASLFLASAYSAQTTTIDTSPFDNSAHHWYDIYADDNVINPQKNYPRYNENEIDKIADNILFYQKGNGGWPKNYDMRAILTFEQIEKIVKSKNILNTTFDNWTTHSHVDYLAKAYTLLKNERYKQACLKGIEYILSAQYSTGGWPQYFPDTSGYRKYITFNDGVIAGIMTVLKKIMDNDPSYNFIDEALKVKVKYAYEIGLRCILNCQIREDGKLNAWCQQHDNITLKPQWARAFEPPSICNGESVGVVLFLMSIENPGKEIIDAVNGAVYWFEESKILGIKIKEKKIKPIKYHYSTIRIDRSVIKDLKALPIWTRYYELKTHRPLFCNRDSKVVYSLAEVQHERRAGYGWYTYAPQEVLDKYLAWNEKWVK
jgi:PelA/Pel-15E family pectate lyase